MLDDIRDHAPMPSPEECRWMAPEGLGTIARGVLLACVALLIGWSASELLDGSVREAVASAGPRSS